MNRKHPLSDADLVRIVTRLMHTSMRPTRSISASITSPGLIGLTPAGVPVMITLPGYRE